MKSVQSVPKLQKCTFCELNGFFCRTPCGADYITCPCCGQYYFLNAYCNNKYSNHKYDFLFDEEYDDDMRNEYNYCNTCGIIFETGCFHLNGGCTSNVFNCHFIKKWKDKLSNIEYDGMPFFENEDDWNQNVNNVIVLQMYCPHKGHVCKNTPYPISDLEKCHLFH